jgi:hypothetical protein
VSEARGSASAAASAATAAPAALSEACSLQGGLKLVMISYTGNENSALGFEMLEALRQGVNYTWNIGYQRSVSKNLQISVQYNGRKSENTSMIHAGGMEVRAFF